MDSEAVVSSLGCKQHDELRGSKMRDQAEQEFSSPTDQADLDASLHNFGAPVDDEMESDVEPDTDYGDVPQEYTESYGTGVQDLPGYTAGGRTMRQRDRQFNAADPDLTGGDIDANYEQAYAVGDEAVGGTVATPDQDIVDELGAAVGLELPDRAFLRTNDLLQDRDDRRWELDPKSSEDYSDRRDEE
ncbi:DUF6335 family protein [Pantanalinema rosaneae CENA516]|uniref:DUF6335 family protein n=1 Tax=Pantanalinema rosaneae TaxID=1620701 RepID=UPI003D7014F3